jgi:hypothetical protein
MPLAASNTMHYSATCLCFVQVAAKPLGNMQAKAAAESSSQAPAATMRQSDDLQPLEQEMSIDQDETVSCESCDGDAL